MTRIKLFGYNIWISREPLNTKTNYKIIATSLGQFTGLTDCNGKEIYEGDILSFPNANDNVDYEKVIFHDGCFQVEDGWLTTEFSRIDTHERIVIGNIHDNPNLIK